MKGLISLVKECRLHPGGVEGRYSQTLHFKKISPSVVQTEFWKLKVKEKTIRRFGLSSR